MEDTSITRENAFYMIDRPSPGRQPGWPLDSLSIYRDSLTYFVDEENENSDEDDTEIIPEDYKKRLVDFLAESLSLSLS